MDNLLCVIARDLKCTLFLDVPALLSGDSQVPKQVVEVSCSGEVDNVRIYDERQVVEQEFMT